CVQALVELRCARAVETRVGPGDSGVSLVTQPSTEEEVTMSNAESAYGFELGDQFNPGELSGGLGLGPLELQYEELFAEVLEDGVITQDERARLEKAADNLGLDRTRLLRLEQAMVEAYQQRHRV